MRAAVQVLFLLICLSSAQSQVLSPSSPWLVADDLLSKGDLKAAQAYATTATGDASLGLGAYLASLEAPYDDRVEREVLREVRAALLAGNPDAALSTLQALGTPRNPVVAVQLQLAKGEACLENMKLETAARAFLQAADIAEGIGWLTGASQALYQAGRARHSRSDLTGALEIFDRRHGIEREIGSKVGDGRSHYAKATVLGTLGRNSEAAEHLAIATRLAEETGDFEYLSKALSTAAHVPARLGHNEEAMALARQSLDALDRVDGSHLPDRFKPDPERTSGIRIGTLLNLAAWHAGRNDKKGARRYLKLAVTAARSAGNPLLLKGTRAHLATFEGVWHERAEEDFEALAEYDRALTLYQENGDRISEADLQRRIGTIHSRLGDHPTALARLQEAISTLEAIGARNELCRAHLKAAHLARTLGSGPDADEHLGQALKLARFMGDAQFEVEAQAGLARISRSRGDYEKAHRHLRDALLLQESSGAEESKAELLMIRARIHGDLGEDGRAVTLVQEAIRIYEQQGEQGSRNNARRKLATIWGRSGRYEEAAEILQTLLDDYRSRMDRRGVALTLSNLADIRFLEGRYLDASRLRAKALGLFIAMRDRTQAVISRSQYGRELHWAGKVEDGFEELSSAMEQALAEGSPGLLGSCAIGLSEAYYFAENFDEAADWALKGLEATEQVGLALADGEGAMLRSGIAPLAETGLSASLRARRPADAFHFLERGRSATLLAALGGRHALSEATVSADLLRREEAARGTEALAVARLHDARRGGNVKDMRRRQRELAGAREKLKECLAEIQRSSRRQADLAYPTIPSVKEVQQSLRKDDALVLYGQGVHEIVALVLTRKEVSLFRLGREEDVLPMARAFLTDPDHPVNLKESEPAARQLIDVLELPKTTRRLLISPGGQLAYVPFSLLAGDLDVVMVPSATAYQLLHDDVRSPGKDVLALGDPEYGPSRADTSSILAMRNRGSVLTGLPASRLEAKRVGDVVLLGKNASETRFRELVSGGGTWRAVHLACHGLVDPDDPTISSLALTADAKNDGFLTSMDVLRMRIPTDLVVLSACDTGRGTVVKGEGLIGLTRAFMLAGAPRVLCSLWKVDDEATNALMGRFYELWNPSRGQGISPARALRLAQKHVRSHKRWRHPTYWAAWVLWGLPD